MKKSQPTEEPADGPVLLRHDSEFSVSSHYEYSDGSPQLNMWQGGILLCADCLGTGLLALPQDIHVLGYALGLGFLIANLPINLFAGTILSHTATAVETRQKVLNRLYQENLSHAAAAGGGLEDEVIDFREMNANTVESEITLPGVNNNNNNDTVNSQLSAFFQPRVVDYGAINMDTFKSNVTFVTTGTTHTQLHHDTATFDFIGMTRALFKSKTATKLVIAIYYINIFLVLGNYILVMSHAVSAAFGGDMCYPTAGLVASIGMFVVSQSRTMAKLGRSASILSLTALLIVVAQCLWAAQTHQAVVDDSEPAEFGILRKLSAFGSIGFAVGSQKLFLNIRHELSDRSVAPKSLALALTVFGTFYVLIVLIAGPNPPGFLFDAIPPGANRRIAGT